MELEDIPFMYRLNTFLTQNRFIRMLRNAFTLIIPLIFLLLLVDILLYFPNANYQNWLKFDASKFNTLLKLIDVFLNALHPVILAFLLGICYEPNENARVEYRALCGILNVLCLFTMIGIKPSALISFDMTSLTLTGSFDSIIDSIFVCPLFYFFIIHTYKFYERNTQRVRPALRIALNSVVPFFGVFLIFLLISIGFYFISSGATIQDETNAALSTIFGKKILSEFAEAFLFTLLIQLTNFLGLDANAYYSAVTYDYYDVHLTNNICSVASGLPPEYIFNGGFFWTFVICGGSGALFALLLILLLTSKKGSNKTMALVSFLPCFFNQGTILAYGIPVIFNPVFLIPFTLAPLINLVIAYVFTLFHVLPIVTTSIPERLPIFFSGYTAGGTPGLLIQILLLLVDMLIYLPFLKQEAIAEDVIYKIRIKNLVKILQHKEEIGEKANLTFLPGEPGLTATHLITDLRDALDENKLMLYYQAQVDKNGKFAGAEALLRWNHPIAGFIYPPLIIIIAEEGRFLDKLESFIFTEACHTIKTMEDQHFDNCKISVNITGASMTSSGFERMIDDAVEESGIQREHLAIEITEQESIASTIELEHLKAKGHKLMIDDFGMGHTSLKYLESQLFDVVKLDGSITKGVTENNRNAEIISSIVSLSQTFDMGIVAEYVEDEPQKEKLSELGCDVFQGYLYAKPLPREDFISRANELQ